jgi:phytoene dehydrogenase-like protein
MSRGEIMASVKNEYDCIIIGGGLGGMICALTLLKRGKGVLLLERGRTLGGCQAYFKRKGFLFEACLHSVAETYDNGPVMNILNSLDLETIPSFVQFDPSFCFVFPDATYAVPREKKEYMGMLFRLFPSETGGIEKIFRIMDDIYAGLGKLPEVVPVIAEYSGKVFQDLLDECVSDNRLQAILSGFWGYLGSPPSKTSALILSGFNGSICNFGNYLPKGGITHVIDPLAKAISDKGGDVRLKSSVEKILLEEGRAAGVVLENGQIIKGRSVISNVDASTTFHKMLGEENLPVEFVNQLKTMRPTLSAFSVYLGVKDGYVIPDNLCPANLVYPSDDLEAQYEAILNGDLEKMPYVFSIPTMVNPSLAPEGHHIINLFTPMPYHVPGFKDWKAEKEGFVKRFVKLTEKVLPGLGSHIVVSDAATPDTLIRYTGNTKGAVGGWDYTPHTIANRPSSKTPITDLWLTGHWTNPGVGIHGVIQSGYITGNLIP